MPVVPDLRVIDVTGCGNAFCGGFLAARAGRRVFSGSSSVGHGSGKLCGRVSGSAEKSSSSDVR